MALINRISRLFTADFHAVLDRIEEPEQLLRQAIREMEDELAAADARIRLSAHEQAALGHRRRELEEKLADLDEELDLCFASEKAELARALVRKKLEVQRLHKRLAAKQAAGEKALAMQQQRIAENRSTLDGLRQKAEIFERQTASTAEQGIDDSSWMARELAVSDDEVEVAFLREQQARRAS
jgi:phage shock protein A